MKSLLIASFTLLFSLASTVYAAPSTYWSVGGGALTFDDGFDTVEPIQLFGRFGHDFNPNFGIGAEVGVSLVEDKLYGLDYDVTTSFLYVKGSLPMGNNSKVYAMAGPTNVELTGSLGSVSASVSDDDLGLGFGYEKQFNNHAISVDYILYNDEDGADVYSINIGYVNYFQL